MAVRKISNSEMEEELKARGLNVLKTWHLVLSFIGLIIYAGGIYGVSLFRIDLLEKKIEKNENWKEEYMEKQEVNYMKILEKLADIKTELYVLKNQQVLIKKENNQNNSH